MDFLKKVRDEPLKDVIKIFHGLQDYTALKAAVTCEREDIVELLLEKNCKVNQNIDTPLHIAVRLGNIKCIQMLLDKKASMTIVNSNGDTPLHVAFQHKKMEIVDLMLDAIEQTSDYLNIKNKQDLTHLHIALSRAKKTVVEGFLAVASNVIKVANNYTVYQELQSLKNQQLEKVKEETIEPSPNLMFQSDSDFKLPVATENLLLSSSSVKEEESNDQENFKSYKNNSDATEFHTICSEAHPDIVRDYLKAGWNVNTLLKDLDSTPLHCAVKECQLENAKVLLEYGADPMLMDVYKATPLHICLYNNDSIMDSQMLRLLYEATMNKDTNLKDQNGMSFLHAAASMNDLQTVQRYLDQGEDVNQKIQGNYHVSFYTALHFAVKYHHQDMVKLLIEHGAEVNSGDIESPLHLACRLGHQGIIELLLEKGAMAHKSYKDKTALHLLVQYIAQHRWIADDDENENKIVRKDHKRKVDFVNSCFSKLIEAGCNINAKDANGNTALHYTCAAKTYNRISILRLLQLGADINVENEEGKTPMEMKDLNWYSGIVDDFMLLYHHVQELKALEMIVNHKNEVCCKKIMEMRAEWSTHENWKLNGKLLSDEELNARNKQRLDEIQKMKNVMLTKKTSLYKFVTTELKSHRVSAKNANLVRILQEIVEENGYPVYGSRIWLRWKKISEIPHATPNLKRKSIFEETENFSDSKRLCI